MAWLSWIDLFSFIAGISANSYVIYRLLKQRKLATLRAALPPTVPHRSPPKKVPFNDVFPLIMAIADLIALILYFPNILSVLVLDETPFLPPIGCVIQATFTGFGYILSNLSFCVYTILRYIIIVYPIKLKLYLRLRHIYALVIFNVLFSLLHESDKIYLYWNQLFSLNNIKCENKQTDLIFYTILHALTSYEALIFLFSVILFSVYIFYKLSEKDTTDINDPIKRNSKAITHIMSYLLIFALFRGVFGLFDIFKFGTPFIQSIKWLEFTINPFLYYQVKNTKRETFYKGSSIRK